MNADNQSDNPAGNSNQEATPEIPSPVAPQQGIVGENANTHTYDEHEETAELAREFRAAEKWAIGINAALAVIAVLALIVYNGQLKEMRKATRATETAAEAARASAETATKQLQLTSQQLEYTQAAKLGLQLEIQSMGKKEGMSLMVRMVNIGGEAASSASICVTVEKGRVKGDRITETDPAVEIVAPYDIWATPRGVMLGAYASDRFEGWTPLHASGEQIEGMRNADIFIQASGSVNYFNGFRHVSDPFCYRHITFHPYNPTEDPSFPVGALVPCVVYPRERDDMLRGKRNFEEAKAKQH